MNLNFELLTGDLLNWLEYPDFNVGRVNGSNPRIEKIGGLAQLARAPALHAGGQRFESVILHRKMAKGITDEKSIPRARGDSGNPLSSTELANQKDWFFND